MRRHAPTSNELTGSSAIVVVPLGSWEQHGPHLPLDTDTVIIEAVVAEALERVRLADRFTTGPTLAITASDEHAGFVGGLSLGTEATRNALIAIARSASWAVGVCFANGHGGNADAVSMAIDALDTDKFNVSTWSLPSYKGADMHAGHTETSLMMHLHPESVRREQIRPGSPDHTARTIETLRSAGVAAVSPDGVLGDPTTASPEHGSQVLDLYARSLAAHLDSLVDQWCRQ